MSRKKGQLLSEISQNLKQTIKKYNELTRDDNFFNDEFKSKSTNNYINKQQMNNNSSSNTNSNNNIYNTNNTNTNNINSNNKNKNIQINDDKCNNNGLLKINEMDEEIINIEQQQNNFVSQLNTLMNNLNILEENINKDFDELENYIENDIEKELISKQ